MGFSDPAFISREKTKPLFRGLIISGYKRTEPGGWGSGVGFGLGGGNSVLLFAMFI
jgi:hypothetical protein